MTDKVVTLAGKPVDQPELTDEDIRMINMLEDAIRHIRTGQVDGAMYALLMKDNSLVTSWRQGSVFFLGALSRAAYRMNLELDEVASFTPIGGNPHER